MRPMSFYNTNEKRPSMLGADKMMVDDGGRWWAMVGDGGL